jgi:hypothetical protein
VQLAGRACGRGPRFGRGRQLRARAPGGRAGGLRREGHPHDQVSPQQYRVLLLIARRGRRQCLAVHLGREYMPGGSIEELYLSHGSDGAGGGGADGGGAGGGSLDRGRRPVCRMIAWCFDVFTNLKKADMVPLKDREQTTITKAFEKILYNLCIPKTIYSDQGSELKNASFRKLLDKHNIKIIFVLGHASFVDIFNKTMKNRMMKYMKLKILIIGLKL